MFIGNGGIADVHVVVATVEPELGRRGQASFVVPKGTPGLVPVRRFSKLGSRAAYTGEFRLDNCRVPADHLLGGQDKLDEKLAAARSKEQSSDSTTLKALERSRPVVAAQAIGGGPSRLRVRPAVRAGAARLRSPCHRAPRCRRAARRHGGGDRRGPSARLACGLDGRDRPGRPVGRGIDGQAQGIRGRHPCRREGRAGPRRARLHRPPRGEVVSRAKVFDIYEGTSQIQRMVIARSLPEAQTPLPLRRGHG